MNKVVPVLALASVAALSGCTNRIADLTYVSTKNISQEEIASATTDGERVEGKDTAHIIVFIPTGNPNVEEALDRAIEKKKGGLGLKNATIHSSSFWIPYVYGQSSIIVEGEVLVPGDGPATER